MSVFGVIGIILLCVLAAAVVLAALAAWFPIPWTLTAFGRNEEITVSGKAKWLFGLLSAEIRYEETDLRYRMKLAGILIKKGTVENLPDLLKDAGTEQGRNILQTADTHGAAGKTVSETAAEEETFVSWICKWAARCKTAYRKYDKIRTILETKSGRRTVKFLKKQILELRNRLKPCSISGKAAYGFSDVALTAVLYGPVGNLLFRLAGEELILLPDFTEAGVDLDIKARGRAQAWPVLSVIFQTMSDEGVQKLRGAVKRILDE